VGFATGLRDALEAFGAFLDECYDVASIMRLIGKNKETDHLLAQDWFDHQADTGTFRQFGIDKKLMKLKPWFQTLTADLQESIRSINRARNILAHHEGNVPESYLNENGKFRISWIRLTLTAMGPEAREAVLGETLKAGEGLGLLAVSEHRDFGKEERLYTYSLLSSPAFVGPSSLPVTQSEKHLKRIGSVYSEGEASASRKNKTIEFDNRRADSGSDWLVRRALVYLRAGGENQAYLFMDSGTGLYCTFSGFARPGL